MTTSASNFLKYSSIDNIDIVNQINTRLAANSNFKNIQESAVSQTLIEIFSAVGDMLSYYLQRRAEENYLDLAKLRSSAILLSRQLGYIVKRPIPAVAKLKIIISGDLSGYGFAAGDKVQIAAQQSFTYNGNNFLLKKSFIYTLTSADILNIGLNREGFELEILEDDIGDAVEILQGELKDKVIAGASNPYVGQIFQRYNINDTTFSNLYGFNDYSQNITRVWVGDVKSDENEFSIDRRSLVNMYNIDNNFLNDNTSRKVCYIRTAVNEGVDLLFGDDNYARMGARTSTDNIYIQYLSTLGADGNDGSVVDKEIQFVGNVYIDNQDITSLTKFNFDTGIYGGADIESLDSIKMGAPMIYASLDRLVTKNDYIAYLKSLTSPIDIKNAIVWGEQEEILNRNYLSQENKILAIKELFNVVFFSCVGSLYQTTTSPYYMRSKALGLDQSVLDVDFDENSFNGQSYYNVYVKNNMVEQLKRYIVNETYWTYKSGGNTITSGSDYFQDTYEDNATLRITYGSDKINNDPMIQSYVDITMDFSSLLVTNDLIRLKDDIATKIQESLSNIIDERGSGSTTNDNYGNNAFSNITCIYLSDEDRFLISTTSADVCYIVNIEDVDSTNSLVSDLGFINNVSVKINNGNEIEISNAITTVVEDLDNRGQVTIKHIYVSPIIHTFDIVGEVYVDSLYDKNLVKMEAENALYAWLDTNADFNINIYKSNIIDIIEQVKGVKYVNLRFDPEDLDGSYYNKITGDSLGILASYSNSTSLIATINSNLDTFLSYSYNYSYLDVDKTIYVYSDVTQYSTEAWSNFINERNFYTKFVKDTYIALSATNFVANNDDFIRVMSCIHKDLLKTIRYNMLDINGNIAREYYNESYYKGGYSLGNEIVKLNSKLNFIYR